MTTFSYQLYSSRNFPPIDATLAMLGGLGYGQVEGYGALWQGIDRLDGLKAALDTAGLHMATGHFGLDMVEERPDTVLGVARALGMEAIYVPYLMPDDRPKDVDGWHAFGARLERAGAAIRDAGLGFGWHNHDFEVAPLGDGTMPLDALLAGGPTLDLELDVAWVQRGGADPLVYMTRYADRIRALHVKDIAPSGEKTDEDGWADVGHGVMDWPAIMKAAEQTNATYFVMEHDNPSDDKRFASQSLAAAQAF